jgi:hypothetical protein
MEDAMSAMLGNVTAGFGEVERACEDHFADLDAALRGVARLVAA